MVACSVLLFVVFRLLFVVVCWLSLCVVVFSLLFVACCRGVLFVAVCRVLFVVNILCVVVCCLLPVGCRWSFAVC